MSRKTNITPITTYFEFTQLTAQSVNDLESRKTATLIYLLYMCVQTFGVNYDSIAVERAN